MELTRRDLCLMFLLNGELVVKFTIEIYGAADAIYRATVSKITPFGARKEARRLFSDWERRGAKSARVLNPHGETVCQLGE
jgi:hypothetical protein